MGNYNRDGGSRGGRRDGFDRGRRSFGGSRPDRQMFNVVCSNCGKDCQVPFRPTSDKPVYCSDCFEKMGNKGNRRSFDRPRHGNVSISDDKFKIQFDLINTKLDKILNLLLPKETLTVSSPVETATEEPTNKKKAKSAKPRKTSKKKK